MNLRVIRNGLTSKHKTWNNLDILEYPCGCRAKITVREHGMMSALLLPSCRLHIHQIYEFERARASIKQSEQPFPNEVKHE